VPSLQRPVLPARTLIPALVVALLPLVSIWDNAEPTPSDGPQFREWLEDQGLLEDSSSTTGP